MYNMWVALNRRRQVGRVEVPADPLYLLLTAEKKFWRCVESGEPPRLFEVDSGECRRRVHKWDQPGIRMRETGAGS
jgi:hypothetical protein